MHIYKIYIINTQKWITVKNVCAINNNVCVLIQYEEIINDVNKNSGGYNGLR